MFHAYPLSARLDHVLLNSPDPDRLAEFYCRAMRMAPMPGAAGAPVLCVGPERKMLFGKGAAGTLGFGAFSFQSTAELTRKRAQLQTAGLDILPSPSTQFDDTAFAVRDPEGNTMVFGVAERAPPDSPAFRCRLQHLVLASPDPEKLAGFYADTIGFWPSDKVVDDAGTMRSIWLRSDEEHHSFAIFRADAVAVDHHSYELEDWNGIRNWSDHFAAEGIELIWGPGRHGPGNNLFIFVRDADGNKIELSAELETLSVHRPVGTWPYTRAAFNLWGSAPLRIS